MQIWYKVNVARETSDFYTFTMLSDRSPGAAGREMPLLMKPSARQWRKMAHWGWLSLTRWWMRTSWSKPWSISYSKCSVALAGIFEVASLISCFALWPNDKSLAYVCSVWGFSLSNLLMGQIWFCLWQVHQEQSFHQHIWNNVCNKKPFIMGKQWDFFPWKLNGKKISQ